MIARFGAMGMVLLAALLLQTVVAPAFGIAGWRPDLVLLTVVAFALADGPGTGARYGFMAGLATDLLSGGSSLVGINALVFLLIGDALGRLRPYMTGTARVGEAALGAVAGAVSFGLYGGLSLLLDIRPFAWTGFVQGVLATALWTGALAPLLCGPVRRLSRRFSGVDAAATASGSSGRAW